jgi:hypothetical protein
MLFTFNLFAQKATNDSLTVVSDTIPSPWAFVAETYYYILPGEKDIPLFFLDVDYNALHVEARYNYEDLKTASLFVGYNFEVGRKLKLAATPMIGIVAGNTKGIAPGMEFTLTWKKLDFYSESEYVFDLEGKENDYFYTWTQLGITPFRNFRTGTAMSRTRIYQSEFEIQKGIFAEYSLNKATVGCHYFNPFSNEYFVIATLSIEF